MIEKRFRNRMRICAALVMLTLILCMSYSVAHSAVIAPVAGSAGSPTVSPEDALGPLRTLTGNSEQGYAKPNTMHFSPSASTEDGIYYVARRGVETVAYFGESEVWYVVGDGLLHLDFPGSSRIIPTGMEPTGSVTNYMYGNDPSKWRTGLMDYSLLRYPDIYPGIDLSYKILDGNLKYEFVVAAHADPSMIRLRYSDADSIRVYDDSIAISKNNLIVTDTGLTVFQENTKTRNVDSTFRYLGPNTVAFSIGEYESSSELVIDPLFLVYGTYIGGTEYDYGEGIAIENGFVYVTGWMNYLGAPDYNSGDCFVVKFAIGEDSLVYSTFLGGLYEERGMSIAVEDGNAYVTGHTRSSDFPIFNAYDSTFDGWQDCFVTKLAADGQSLVYSTFLGGSSAEDGLGIAVENGYAYVSGSTASDDFPTVNAYDTTWGGNSYYDCFVTKFAADGQSLVYSTYLGGGPGMSDEANSIAVESGYAYVTGTTSSFDFPTVNAYDSTYNSVYDPTREGDDCFVTKFELDGQSLVYSTFLGGESWDYGFGIAVENGYAYVAGTTYSSDFPTVNAYDSTHGGVSTDYTGADCFVTKFAADGQSLIYSTFLGGVSADDGMGIAVENGYVYVSGFTYSPDFPTVDAYDSTLGANDCFVTKFEVDGQSLVYSTFLGGWASEFGMDIAQEGDYVCVTGWTYSSDFPITANAYDPTYSGGLDCFVAVLMSETLVPPTPTEQAENIASIVAEIPREDFDGRTKRVQDHKKQALLNMLEVVITYIQTAEASSDPAVINAAYQSAIDQLNSILDKTDGCAERGTPDTIRSGYTPDWITTCESQALIDPLIRELIATLEALLIT